MQMCFNQFMKGEGNMPEITKIKEQINDFREQLQNVDVNEYYQLDETDDKKYYINYSLDMLITDIANWEPEIFENEEVFDNLWTDAWSDENGKVFDTTFMGRIMHALRYLNLLEQKL